ncbi:MAG: chromate transporter [Oscillospiraceae bacterium]|jgi:chromate transporter|nr:chromate transporter [Oscillospiraceae bacterium]
MNLFELFFIFFKLGAFTFGGGYAMVPLINQELVATGLLTQTEALDMIAISQMTPGPLGINAATFAGMRASGIPGAIAATLGAVLPSFIIAVIVARFFFKFKESAAVRALLSGMRPVVLALIAASGLSVALETFAPGGAYLNSWLWENLDIPALCVGAVCAALVFGAKKIPPVAIILASGVFGAIFLR